VEGRRFGTTQRGRGERQKCLNVGVSRTGQRTVRDGPITEKGGGGGALGESDWVLGGAVGRIRRWGGERGRAEDGAGPPSGRCKWTNSFTYPPFPTFYEMGYVWRKKGKSLASEPSLGRGGFVVEFLDWKIEVGGGSGLRERGSLRNNAVRREAPSRRGANARWGFGDRGERKGGG